MYRRKKSVTLIAIFIVLFCGVAIGVCRLTGMAKADGPMPSVPTTTPTVTATPTSDPCFRTDPECYGEPPTDIVECDDNTFVPRNADGTWTCPTVQTQLPEEVIGRQIDCPDGSVGRIVDVEGHSTCDATTTPTAIALPTEDPVASQDDNAQATAFSYGALAGGGLVAAILGTMYFIFRKKFSA